MFKTLTFAATAAVFSLAATTGAMADTKGPQAAGATGDTPTSTATPTADPAAPKEKQYCVSDTATGSRLAVKVCKTRKQWMDQEGFDPLNP